MAKKVQVTVTDKMEAKTGGTGPQSSRKITRKLCPNIEYWIYILNIEFKYWILNLNIEYWI